MNHPMDTTALTRLFRSKSPRAQLLGTTIALFMFAPDVFRVIGDESLDVWQRLEQVTIAATQTLLTVSLAAMPPEVMTGESGRSSSEAEAKTEGGDRP